MNTQHILEALWNIDVCTHKPNTVTDHALSEKTLLLRKRLADTLTDQQKEFLEEYEATCDELCFESEKNVFSKGFRLGAKIILAIFDD